MMGDFREQRRVVRDEPQSVVHAHELDPTIARDVLDDIGAHVWRQRVLAEAFQHVDRLGGAQPGSSRVPQRQRRDPIRVDVLRALLELREARQRVARVRVPRIVDLDQNRPVPLDDQRVGGVARHTVPL